MGKHYERYMIWLRVSYLE